MIKRNGVLFPDPHQGTQVPIIEDNASLVITRLCVE